MPLENTLVCATDGAASMLDKHRISCTSEGCRSKRTICALCETSTAAGCKDLAGGLHSSLIRVVNHIESDALHARILRQL